MALSVSSCSITETGIIGCDRFCHTVLFFTLPLRSASVGTCWSYAHGARRRKCAKSPFPMASGKGTASDPAVRFSRPHAACRKRALHVTRGRAARRGRRCGGFRMRRESEAAHGQAPGRSVCTAGRVAVAPPPAGNSRTPAPAPRWGRAASASGNPAAHARSQETSVAKNNPMPAPTHTSTPQTAG